MKGEYSPATPIFGSIQEMRVAPKFEMSLDPTPSEIAYQIVHDEAMLDGNSRLNMATFVTTWMDDYARRVMIENMDKNMIDKTEYPQTAEIERRCVNIMAKLWHSPEAEAGDEKYCMGTSTVGSSEACMLGGMAALKRWKERCKRANKPYDKPNIVISSCCQVVWEKFCVYWDVEMREVPVTLDKITLDAADALGFCDENTILIVPIQGVTQTGLNDDVQALDAALDTFNTAHGLEIAIHIDAATGGFILPFVDPDCVWDFRLKWVFSISTSGHKFGLVYPGVGWIVWRDASCLPKEMNFEVNYLGDSVPSISINFSRPGNQVLAQYYQFIRLGMEGYRKVQQNVLDICHYLRGELQNMGEFEFLSEKNPNPLFIWKLKEDKNRKWNLYDLQDALLDMGWQVPAYTLPASLEDVVVMRVVVRQGTGMDLANLMIKAITDNVRKLNQLDNPTQNMINWDKGHKIVQKAFSHNR